MECRFETNIVLVVNVQTLNPYSFSSDARNEVEKYRVVHIFHCRLRFTFYAFFEFWILVENYNLYINVIVWKDSCLL